MTQKVKSINGMELFDSKAVKSINGVMPDENGNVELTGCATEQFVRDGFQPKGNYLTEVPEGYAKTEDIPTKPEDIGALPDTYTPPNQTAEQVGADPKGTASSAVSQHNTADDSHNDIRLELKAINDRLTAFFDSDDQTLDELSEIVAYITSNKSLIDSVTTSKVSVADIINNLTTNVSNKPLSAAQGVALKGLIDVVSNSLANYQTKGDYALRSELPTVPTKVSAFENDKGYLTQHQDISGKLDADKLPEAINDALAQAKENGEFDGTNGKSAYEVAVYNGFDGTEKEWLASLKGEDYVLTEADKTEIVRMVIESLGGNPIFGYVDENNNIIVSGNLADGSYSVKYEMEDGSTVDIGDLVLDTNVYYSITNNLTNCINNNGATQVVDGGSYIATITANSGYTLGSVSVTMGGSAVSVNGGVINIASVTGDIVITAVAEETETEHTNFFDASQGFYGRLNSAGGDRTDITTLFVTNYISVQQGDIIAVDGCDVCPQFSSGANHYMTGYDSNKANVHTDNTYVSNSYWTVDSLTDNNAQFTVLDNNIAYFRFTCGNPLGYSETVDTSKIVINIKRNGEWL